MTVFLQVLEGESQEDTRVRFTTQNPVDIRILQLVIEVLEEDPPKMADTLFGGETKEFVFNKAKLDLLRFDRTFTSILKVIEEDNPLFVRNNKDDREH